MTNHWQSVALLVDIAKMKTQEEKPGLDFEWPLDEPPLDAAERDKSALKPADLEMMDEEDLFESEWAYEGMVPEYEWSLGEMVLKYEWPLGDALDEYDEMEAVLEARALAPPHHRGRYQPGHPAVFSDTNFSHR